MNAVVVDTSPQLRPAQEGVPQDWLRLAEHLARYGMELSLGEPPRQFAGGLANLNYLLMIDGRETVLRRPPPGKLPPGAYDMGREFGILKRVSKGFHLAPEAIHLCDDPEVLGAPSRSSNTGAALRCAAMCRKPLPACRTSAIASPIP